MDYDARKDSLLTEEEYQKVLVYFTIEQTHLDAAYLIVHQKFTNEDKKRTHQTKLQRLQRGRATFPDSLQMKHHFERRQQIIVEVMNEQKGRVGTATAYLGELVNMSKTGIEKPIEGLAEQVGVLSFALEKVDQELEKYVKFEVEVQDLDVGGCFYSCLEDKAKWTLFKVKQGQKQEIALYESEWQQKGDAARYSEVKMRELKLCNHNSKQPIIFRFESDWGRDLGDVQLDLDTLIRGKRQFRIAKEGEEMGRLLIHKFQQSTEYAIIDYLKAGMEMAMVVCIDFTASNLNQKDPNSLHYVSRNIRSKYEQALQETGRIVLDYDADKLVPVFGFGAKVNLPKLSSKNKIHHCFPLNGNEEDPNLIQMQGLMEGYRQALPYLTFSGPTYFAPFLREAMNVCLRMKEERKEYMILLILTDGNIHDKEQVFDLLVKCGKLPLSIIIIGIGDGQDGWQIMHQLDDDDCQMVDKQGNPTQRDLVQFVEFQKYNNDGVELATQVLWELPRQVDEYHKLVGLTPKDYQRHRR